MTVKWPPLINVLFSSSFLSFAVVVVVVVVFFLFFSKGNNKMFTANKAGQEHLLEGLAFYF